jgi:hypothetical protein
MTQAWRQEAFGVVSGGASSTAMEKYQRAAVVEGTGVACPKTNMRINLRTSTLHDIAHPNKQADGFDYTEDFDGVQTFGDTQVFLNFKSIVGKGGSQTRSLREVHRFVEGQLNVLKTTPTVRFANILDGDESDAQMDKFMNLLDRAEYSDVKAKVYVGDLQGYFGWITSAL